MKKILYLECYSGISGDMTVGALLDLGARKEKLEQALECMGIEGYHLHFGRKQKNGIDAFDFDVHLEEQEHDHHEEACEHHHHEGACEHHHHEEACEHHHHEEACEHHHHEEACEHHHHEGAQEHIHRNIQDIFEVINRLEVKESVKKLSGKIFSIVAEAESKAHGIPVKEVHFHEVGAVDSIIDIVATAVCLDDLGIDEVIVSSLAEGHGYVQCQHGIMPVPVPATVNIAAAYGLELQPTQNEGEMVTPTGAAIAAALHCGRSLPDHYRILKIGIGAGNKDFKNANILRAMIIEPIEAAKHDELWVLETNMDDCTGEALGFTMECLLEAGAADVWYAPIYMKKNRPAYLLQVLCSENKIEEMEALILRHTTTIGIRKHPVSRTTLERKIETVSTVYGEVKVKVCFYKERVFCYPEYESIRKICRNNDIEFALAYHMAAEEAMKIYLK